MNPELRAIGAMSENGVIGIQNRLPWHIPEELQWFREATHGQTVVMGRKTFESIGHPLADRIHVVLTSNPPKINPSRVLYFSEMEEILRLPGKVWICGGESLYRQFLPHCRELFLTLVKRTVAGDTFFPEFRSLFTFRETLRTHSQFEIQRWERSK
ncbi:MAG: dihydrofolate reductase [Puniceicoccales bacterium]|jgi:dihydrofolate reductase|nr:dihydrofolate reductase [Puniceicoccales bacterium]